MKLEDITLDDVDNIKDIKIDRRKSSNERMLEFIKKLKIHTYLKLTVD